jgi:tRNA pseudouridine55 synthase
VDALLSSFPKIFLPDELARRFLHGQRLAIGKEGVEFGNGKGRVRVYRATDQRLLGTAQMQEFDVLAPERLVVVENN